MKKVFIFSIFSLAMMSLTNSANAQCNGGNCYAYGHHKNYSASRNEQPNGNKEVKPDKQVKEDKQGDSKNSEQVQDKKKYNAAEFKTKHYFFTSL